MIAAQWLIGARIQGRDVKRDATIVKRVLEVGTDGNDTVFLLPAYLAVHCPHRLIVRRGHGRWCGKGSRIRIRTVAFRWFLSMKIQSRAREQEQARDD